MSKKPSKKQRSKTKNKSSLKKTVKRKWGTISFLLLFGGIMMAFYLFWATDFFQNNLLKPLLNLNAKISGSILNLFGENVTVVDDRISSDSFQITIRKGCDGVEAIALYLTAVATYPIIWSKKALGLFAGALFLFLMNLIRIVSLFLSGVHVPSIFEFMHVEVWQVLYIILAIGTWLFWIRWSNKSKSSKNG